MSFVLASHVSQPIGHPRSEDLIEDSTIKETANLYGNISCVNVVVSQSLIYSPTMTNEATEVNAVLYNIDTWRSHVFA